MTSAHSSSVVPPGCRGSAPLEIVGVTVCGTEDQPKTSHKAKQDKQSRIWGRHGGRTWAEAEAWPKGRSPSFPF